MNPDRLWPDRVTKIVSLAFAATMSVSPCALAGAVYQWTDADGAIHFTDDPGKIPKKFRDTVKEISPPEEPDEPLEPGGSGLPSLSQPGFGGGARPAAGAGWSYPLWSSRRSRTSPRSCSRRPG